MGDVESGLCLTQFFALPLALFVQPANAVEGFFDVGEAVDDRAAIGLQQLILTRRGLVALSAEAAVIEDRRDQPRSQVVERTADQVIKLVSARAELRRQCDSGQHRGASDFDISLGGRQLCFGASNVRAMGEQIARHTAGNPRPLQAIE